MGITTVGLDIAKQIFQVCGADTDGRVVPRKKLRRNQVAAFFAHLPSCVVGLEACCGSHSWARALSRCGHPAHADLASEPAPCRHCLRLMKAGEERQILFTFDRFAELEPLPITYAMGQPRGKEAERAAS
jgi:hypothetical protein